MGSFRVSIPWDPQLIVAQIICIQATFYSVQTILVFLFSNEPSLEQIFDGQPTRFTTIVQMLSACICGVAFRPIVEKSRQCLDFAITLHFWNFVSVFFYTRRYRSIHFAWWFLQLISVSLCTVIGEFFCMQKESAEIQLSLPTIDTKR